jgi:hypothetical protein
MRTRMYNQLERGFGPLSALSNCSVVVGVEPARTRFCKLLQKYHIDSPNDYVMDKIETLYTLRMVNCSSAELAIELYDMVKSMPGTSTKGHLLTQHDLRVNGPLDPSRSPNVLKATTKNGRPSVLKLLGATASTDARDGEAAAFMVCLRSCRFMACGEQQPEGHGPYKLSCPWYAHDM